MPKPPKKVVTAHLLRVSAAALQHPPPESQVESLAAFVGSCIENTV